MTKDSTNDSGQQVTVQIQLSGSDSRILSTRHIHAQICSPLIKGRNKTICVMVSQHTFTLKYTNGGRFLPVRLTAEFFLRLLDSIQLAILSALDFEHLHKQVETDNIINATTHIAGRSLQYSSICYDNQPP